MLVLTLIVIALGTMFTRFAPFVLFKNIEIKGKYESLLHAIPYATISLLLVYAFKDVDKTTAVPTIIASTVCVLLYKWKRNTILSIVIPTAIYMLLIQGF